MDLPDIGRYRRRFIVEFGPEDAGLVDRMGAVHRTKRAAIIAGLRLLESGEVEQLRTGVADLEQELRQAQERLAAAQKDTGKAAPELTKARAELKAEQKAHAATRNALANAQQTLRGMQARQGQAEQAILALQTERDRLADRLPRTAHCPNCNKLVPETEWAEQATSAGVDLYHKPDGYRTGQGILSRPSTILFQRRTPGQAT